VFATVPLEITASHVCLCLIEVSLRGLSKEKEEEGTKRECINAPACVVSFYQEETLTASIRGREPRFYAQL